LLRVEVFLTDRIYGQAQGKMFVCSTFGSKSEETYCLLIAANSYQAVIPKFLLVLDEWNDY
jgi:hypothetical protein